MTSFWQVVATMGDTELQVPNDHLSAILLSTTFSEAHIKMWYQDFMVSHTYVRIYVLSGWMVLPAKAAKRSVLVNVFLLNEWSISRQFPKHQKKMYLYNNKNGIVDALLLQAVSCVFTIHGAKDFHFLFILTDQSTIVDCTIVESCSVSNKETWNVQLFPFW